jgi:hypothetical protein
LIASHIVINVIHASVQKWTRNVILKEIQFFSDFFVLWDAYLFENIYLQDERGELKGKRSVVLWCFGVTAKADQSTVKKGN